MAVNCRNVTFQVASSLCVAASGECRSGLFPEDRIL
jgi:hypothetical protein